MESAIFAGADHHIEALLDHVHQPVREVELQRHLRVRPGEDGQWRRHQHADQGQADAQDAAWCGRLRDLLLGGLDLAEDRPAALEKARTLGCEGDAAPILLRDLPWTGLVSRIERLDGAGRWAITRSRVALTGRLKMKIGLRDDVDGRWRPDGQHVVRQGTSRQAA